MVWLEGKTVNGKLFIFAPSHCCATAFVATASVHNICMRSAFVCFHRLEEREREICCAPNSTFIIAYWCIVCMTPSTSNKYRVFDAHNAVATPTATAYTSHNASAFHSHTECASNSVAVK